MNTLPDKYYVITALPEVEMLEKWQDLLLNSILASHYVTPDFFADPFVGAGRKFAVFALNGERIDAVLTGLVSNEGVTSGLGVRPQIAFRDGIDKAAAAVSLMRGVESISGPLVRIFSWEAIEELDNLGYRHELCNEGDHVVMLDPSEGAENLFKQFSERRRTDLRKVMKKGELEIRIVETDSELAGLYQVHTVWCESKGIKPDDLNEFHVNLNRDHRTAFIAIHQGNIIAGTYLRYCKGGLVEYAANNSLAEYSHLRPNELLGWRAIEWVCENGFTKFSLGASHPFLKRFGGEIVATRRYQLDRTFLRFHANRERAERLAVKAFQALPEPVRQRIKAVAVRG